MGDDSIPFHELGEKGAVPQLDPQFGPEMIALLELHRSQPEISFTEHWTSIEGDRCVRGVNRAWSRRLEENQHQDTGASLRMVDHLRSYTLQRH